MANKRSKRPEPGNIELEMVIAELRSGIGTIEENVALYYEKNFCSRANAIDDLEFHIIERIDGLLQNDLQQQELAGLKGQAERIALRLQKIDHDLFQWFRMKIQTGECRGTAFRNMIGEFFGDNSREIKASATIGYDNLDLFFDGLFPIKILPEETKEREPEMVSYQKTPARIVLELVDKARFNKEDVFYDLGSGLGQVAILANLLSGVTAKGVEYEPAYCNFALACVADLNLPDVHFINADARAADYSDGTVFFMYTPFEGGMLSEVLENLRTTPKGRAIKLFTYGPCSLDVARQSWLQHHFVGEIDIYKLLIFSSL